MSGVQTPPVVPRLTSRPLPARREQPKAVLIHTTGSSKLDAVLRYYDDPSGLQPHYVIGYDGVVYQTADEHAVAYHCAILPAERDAYIGGFAYWSKMWWDTESNGPKTGNGLFPGYARWIQRWRPKYESPLDFITGRSPNQISIGIELLQPNDDIKTADIFTDAQYTALGEMLEDICSRYQIPMDQSHVMGHSDVSPMRRSTSRGGWDPGDATNWERILGP